MSSLDYEIELGETERAMVDTVHRFAEEVMRPVGQELDRMQDPQKTIDEGSIVWDAMAKYRELAIDTLSTGDTDMTPIERARLSAIISEELGWGDAGLALTLTT